MGCYDTVKLKCPKCGAIDEHAQSKSGACLLKVFESLEETPSDVLRDVNRHAPFTCICGCVFEVGEFQGKMKEVKYRREENS